MQTKHLSLLGIMALVFVVFSCVPGNKFQELKSEKERCGEERDALKAKNEELASQNKEFNAQMKRFQEENDNLKRDTSIKGSAYRTLTTQYDKINDLYQTLLENTEKLREGADAETKKALALLQKTRDQLKIKEDELNALEEQLNEEKANLQAIRTKLELKESELDKKDQRVEELERILNKKDSLVDALQKKVADALIGFEGQGLTVTRKNGKVYVSLEEKLLFQSGKWDVDPRGVRALKKLAKVLERNPDINIMIEGHTDDVPYNGGTGISDNWDLSVKRATSIVKILLEHSELDPKRLIASGRGPHLPVDPSKTTEARRKNRRTEIILTPKLDELMEILEID